MSSEESDDGTERFHVQGRDLKIGAFRQFELPLPVLSPNSRLSFTYAVVGNQVDQVTFRAFWTNGSGTCRSQLCEQRGSRVQNSIIVHRPGMVLLTWDNTRFTDDKYVTYVVELITGHDDDSGANKAATSSSFVPRPSIRLGYALMFYLH